MKRNKIENPASTISISEYQSRLNLDIDKRPFSIAGVFCDGLVKEYCEICRLCSGAELRSIDTDLHSSDPKCNIVLPVARTLVGDCKVAQACFGRGSTIRDNGYAAASRAIQEKAKVD